MEKIMRDFKRDAPGRSRKSASTSNAAATAIRRLEERSFTAPLPDLRGALSQILIKNNRRLILQSSEYGSTASHRKSAEQPCRGKGCDRSRPSCDTDHPESQTTNK